MYECINVYLFQVGHRFALVKKCNELDAPDSSLDDAKLSLKQKLSRAVLFNRTRNDGNLPTPSNMVPLAIYGYLN